MAARGAELERERARGECDNAMVSREREELSSWPAAFGLNSMQMKKGDEIIRQAD